MKKTYSPQSFVAVDKRVTRPWVRLPTTTESMDYYDDLVIAQKPKRGFHP